MRNYACREKKRRDSPRRHGDTEVRFCCNAGQYEERQLIPFFKKAQSNPRPSHWPAYHQTAPPCLRASVVNSSLEPPVKDVCIVIHSNAIILGVFVEEVQRRFDQAILQRVVGAGHVGDG